MVETAEMSPDLAGLIGLCHHRWAVPALAALAEERGAKFATLARRLDVQPESLRRALGALIDADFVMRNPGYGHPMRPEYILAPFGEMIAPACARAMERIARLDAQDACLNKWSLPVLAGMRLGAERFGDLRAALPGVTPRALTLALKALIDADLAVRTIVAEHPPTSLYRPSRRGGALAVEAADLARAAALR